jgi:hypothetical protein
MKTIVRGGGWRRDDGDKAVQRKRGGIQVSVEWVLSIQRYEIQVEESYERSRRRRRGGPSDSGVVEDRKDRGDDLFDMRFIRRMSRFRDLIDEFPLQDVFPFLVLFLMLVCLVLGGQMLHSHRRGPKGGKIRRGLG